MLPQKMASVVVGFSALFQKNCTEILLKIFLYLDPRSLHRSRQVCQQWNTFILSSVWGSRSGFNTLQRRLHYNWLNTDPKLLNVENIEVSWPLALRDNCLVVARRKEDGATVIGLVSKGIVAHLHHHDEVVTRTFEEDYDRD